MKRQGDSLEKPRPTNMAQQQQQQAQAGYTYDNVPPQPVPLKYVVQEAVKRYMGAELFISISTCSWKYSCLQRFLDARWFDDTLSEAQRGDVKQQALVGQMYAEGFGCQRDPKVCARMQ